MKNRRYNGSACVLALVTVAVAPAENIRVNDPSLFQFENAQIENTTYHGHPALKITEKEAGPTGPGQALAVLKDLQFHNGVIELDVSGAPSKTADPTARGFIGILFRLQRDAGRTENIYLRPSNARAGDQLARNHSAQYCSPPDWGWKRLRDETPGLYESYADMQPGEWVHMKIVVHGKDAELYVGGAQQATLVVRDMKLGDSQGGVALWIGPGTEGYFRDLKITPQ